MWLVEKKDRNARKKANSEGCIFFGALVYSNFSKGLVNCHQELHNMYKLYSEVSNKRAVWYKRVV